MAVKGSGVELRKGLRQTAAALVAGLVIVFCCGGCAFYWLEGNGPKTLESYLGVLPSATAAQLSEWKQEAFEPYLFFGKLSVRGGGDAEGYVVHYHPTPFWPLLIGPYRVRKYWQPEPSHVETKRALIAAENSWGISGLLFYTGTSDCYDERSGLCVAHDRGTIVAVLLVFHSGIHPAEGLPGVSELDTDLRQAMYNRYSSWSLGWGLLAGGTKNDRAYLQVLWIPIPLWSVG